MTVLDDTTNGWRRVLLPTAHTDDLVRLAVIAAAALHLQSSTNQDTASSTSAHEQALDRLRARQNLTTQSLPEQQGVLLALLVLLAASMIRGSTDFRLIFSLLDKAIAAVGGEENVCAGELGTFIVRQIRKYGSQSTPLYLSPTSDEQLTIQIPRLCLPNALTSSRHRQTFENLPNIRTVIIEWLGGFHNLHDTLRQGALAGDHVRYQHHRLHDICSSSTTRLRYWTWLRRRSQASTTEVGAATRKMSM